MDQTLFEKIISRQIPAKLAYEDKTYIAIHDIAPQAPVHLLLIPKRAIPTLNDLQPADSDLVGGLFLLAAKLMKEMGHSDYRTVFNCGKGAAAVGVPSAPSRACRPAIHLAAGVNQRREVELSNGIS